MRYVYVDEAGTSAREPVSVVAGVIIHPDTQWRAIESEINQLLDRYVPSQLQKGFVFSAKDVFGGGRHRDQWPQGARLALLHEMISIPSRFRLPIAYGMMRRKQLDPEVYEAAKNVSAEGMDHHVAFTLCIAHADRYLRLHTNPEEVATVVMEDVSHMRKLLRAVPGRLRSDPIDLPEGEIKVSKIVDCAHYAEKTEAPLLQLADACAFTLRRWVNRESQGDDLIKSMHGNDSVSVEGYAQPLCGGFWL